MCNSPVLIWWMKYMSIYRICMGTTHCATLGTTAEFLKKKKKNKKKTEGNDVSSSKKREQQIRQQPQC